MVVGTPQLHLATTTTPSPPPEGTAVTTTEPTPPPQAGKYEQLIAEPAVLQAPELWFNAARLDRSIALAIGDWAALAHPRPASIIA